MTTEFTGQDLAEAIAVAAGALDLPPERLKFSVIEMGSKGFLGLGRRKARIAVDPDDPTLDLSEVEPQAPLSAPSAPVTPEAPPPEGPELTETPKAPKSEEPEPKAPTAPTTVPTAPRPKRPAPTVPPTAHPKVPAALLDLPALTRPGPGETRVDNPDDETARLARTVVTDILSRLGLSAELALVRLGSRLVVNLDGPDRALLIGARGATLEALQLLAAKILAKKFPDKKSPGEDDRSIDSRLILDVADYRFRRHSQMMENLRREVETARRTGQPQPLTGLSSAERRLARLALGPVKDLELKAGRSREGLVLVPAAPVPAAAAPATPEQARPEPGSGKRRKKFKGGPR